MFNLLMFNVDWRSGSARVPIGRMFEFTDDGSAAEFRGDAGRPLLDRLAALPCLFCWEGTDDEEAYVGRITSARIVGTDVSIEVGLDTDAPPLENSVIYANRAELRMPNEFEFSRNHWAVKDADLYRFLLRRSRRARQRPVVFKIPECEKLEPDLASVMMPFDPSFDGVNAAIRTAAAGASLRCKRADDIWENPAIIQDVVALIDRSRVVVCDCTGRNPNVFYEVGIAHTLGREVILIAQSGQDIPFGLGHLHHIRYRNDARGRGALTSALAGRMKAILGP